MSLWEHLNKKERIREYVDSVAEETQINISNSIWKIFDLTGDKILTGFFDHLTCFAAYP